MIIAVYKREGETSRGVVNRVQDLAKRGSKVGHGGTLDPFARGVLVVAVGREDTKRLHTEIFEEKEYVGVVRIGVKSSTDDREGEKEVKTVSFPPKLTDVEKVLRKFSGVTWQTPPAFSAVKVKGKRSYKLARKGVISELKKRKANIKEIEVLSYRYPLLKIRVVTGPGVYIRALARDIGETLGSGGYLYSLLRTRVGEVTLEDCINLKKKKND